ncbi:bifunctional chorismate mutase/prephenate dehydratase [Sandaracinus amylolyticus]|uniref:bifunctional chorismate mutase/prephenate dehydratase n=1 Tax=Sandaracinus amylolyticus TaxID=927083 RepID=UPI001F383351|nr:prephenate dehydratase domain-containing protein [Sandaracinus amylolyticus]UJR80788.1 Prephenate dehydratase [Sandaracinus amylolyticus]
MADSRDEMAQIRAALEQADADLVAALDARARAIRGYVALRERDPEGYHVLPNPAEVLTRVRELRREFPENGLEPVVREVLGVCAAMIAPVQVAVLGPEAGLTHLAARRWFGSQAEVRAMANVTEVFAEIDRGRAAHAVVPFETSTDGALSATLSCLVETSAKVIGEVSAVNAWHLWSRTGNAGDVEKIYGAATTIAACERTLKAEFPRATLLDVRSGVVAAQLALEDHGAAAVGSELLGELGTTLRIGSERPAPMRTERGSERPVADTLRLVRKHVEDDPGATTRFVVLGQQQPRRTGADRTMIVLALSEDPGSLYAALQPFAERGINLTRLESRPARSSAWRLVFFVELDGHGSDRAVLTAIDEVKARARHLKVLGSYPRP